MSCMAVVGQTELGPHGHTVLGHKALTKETYQARTVRPQKKVVFGLLVAWASGTKYAPEVYAVMAEGGAWLVPPCRGHCMGSLL